MIYENIILSIEAGVATLTFNRPSKLNAMNAHMMNEIIAALEQTNIDEKVRVVVITGAGKAFMAGADIVEYAQQTKSNFNRFQNRGRCLYAAIEGHRCPVVAALNGVAFGGGFEISLACDMILAVAGSQAGLPEILLNLIPGGGGTQRLPKKLGINRAMELLLTGKGTSVEQLQAWGIINHIYPEDSFAEDVRQFAKALAERAPEPVRLLKQLARSAWGGVDSANLAIENQLLETYYLSDAGQQQIQAFCQRSLERSQRKAKTGS
ncbi:enoyl-CoA hydratase/isomerase family protein [Cerasicoccus arenae]|uniref:Enoyl-CoA hydratase n=1 Tax=Cerasicoccus arenae TaxID=424488 RepID=A0A8J3GDH7_9BACT|nr:enoyl-CoA hydratase/isomerase family protein [Cerasicoccus arenae]MBK1859274.1 enoyl-CoA hydratase/isomerase family protein [Cerasicoccus arenae]GHC01571.1 enoyl-CoA hydratase [Cerasicoccus arenae]